MIVSIRRGTLVVVLSILIIGVLSSMCMAMPNQVKDGTQAEATDLVATIDWEGTPIGPIGDDEFKVLSIE